MKLMETFKQKTLDDRKKEGSIRFYKPKFSYIFCDMDGTLLNSESQIYMTTAKALKEALSRGVKVVIATGKARPAVINILKKVDLTGKDGIISEYSPGVFLQAFLYSLEHKTPLVVFASNRCLRLFDHPLVDSLHTIYHEPKKLLFFYTAERVATSLRPYWSEATDDRANVIQALLDMLEIVPCGTSKGHRVKMLLDHLGVTAKEIMAIGDGENDIEMLELAYLGIALSNGSAKTKSCRGYSCCE